MLVHGRSLENHNITQIYAIMITQIPNCMYGARTLKIHQDGAAPGLHRPTSTTGGQPLIHSPRTSGRRGGGVGILVNNAIKVTFRRIHVSPQITSFKLMEAVLTICSISLRLIAIYRMPPPK